MATGRLKKGAKTGFADINGNDILVGDDIRLEDGTLWDVNSYMQVIPKGEGKARKLREVYQHCEVVTETCDLQKALQTVEAPEAEKPLMQRVIDLENSIIERSDMKFEISARDIANELLNKCNGDLSSALEALNCTNKQLVDTLRGRGVEVTAREAVTTYIDL